MQQKLSALLGVLLIPTMSFAGDIVTDGRLKSTAPTGPPLEVASEVMVLNLNADMVDGVEGTDLYARAEIDAKVAAAGGSRFHIGPTASFPIVIDQPGSYVFTADLTVWSSSANAVEIEVDHVTLDLAGHVIRGPGGSISTGTGIYANDVHNVTIHSGTVTGFKYGILLSSTSASSGGGHRLHDLTGSDCDYAAIRFSRGTARDCVTHGSSTGLGCEHCTVLNCQSFDNLIGFELIDAAAVNCTATENTGYGFAAGNATLTGCVASFNENHGIQANSGTAVIGCSVANNTGLGIDINSAGVNVVNSTGIGNDGGNISNCGVASGCHQNYLP
jgi:hypothetical protein